MPSPPNWRVRVLRSVEAWVEVSANTAAEAAAEARKIPGVLSVFPPAIRADIPIVPIRPVGVLEENHQDE